MKTLVITPGDPDGIGAEVTAKALHKLKSKLKPFSVIIFGSKKPFQPFKKLVNHKNITFIDLPIRSDPGFQAGWSIEQATKLVLSSPNNHALITGPINKLRLNDGGYKYQGHTDFLGSLCDVKNPTMMLVSPFFRVSLVTQHCSIKQISEKLNEKLLLKTITDTAQFLQNTLKIKKPKIAILGLNPHAGEAGLLGQEETSTILPTIESARLKLTHVKLSGPHSADSFFGVELQKKKNDRFDAIVAMYHDQGLIPIKMLGFHKSINITLGLPIIRTSVDHGTAFDLVGENKANADSMILALETSMEFLNLRKNKKGLNK